METLSSSPVTHSTENWHLPIRPVPRVLLVYAVLQIVVVALLWINHIGFPLNLEAMELTGLQHLRRILAGMPLYPSPSPEFIPLAYNPLYYYLCLPFVAWFGDSLMTMRLVAIIGMASVGILLFQIIYQETHSRSWGILGVGLFTSAYQAMDTYLDNAHRDSWMVLLVLLGCLWINRYQAVWYNAAGVMLLVIAFWFKQQGSVFIAGGLLFLTWRDGWRQSSVYWLIALLFAPVLYLLMPEWGFGSHFHYFTWEVPHQWVDLTRSEVWHFIKHVIRNYFVLAIVSGVVTVRFLRRLQDQTPIWYFMLPVAALSGALATLTPGSNNNVYIPLGIWFIVVGTLGLYHLSRHPWFYSRWRLSWLAIATSFALFAYNPLAVMVSPRAPAAYRDLVSYLNTLNATVYAPWIGQLQDGYTFKPSLHWVALEDLIRAPGVDTHNHPRIRELLDTVLHPQQQAYILHNSRLEDDPLLSFLTESYVLEADLGDRFSALAALPKRFILNYPRYLYRSIDPQFIRSPTS